MRPVCFALFVFLVSCDCSVALPHDTMGLSAVCDCGIFLIILTFYFSKDHPNIGKIIAIKIRFCRQQTIGSYNLCYDAFYFSKYYF